jgi:hypothetical protein
MIDKRLRSEIAQRKRIISAEEALNFDNPMTRFIKAGSMYILGCLGGTYKLLRGYPPSPQLVNKPFSIWRGVFLIILSFIV